MTTMNGCTWAAIALLALGGCDPETTPAASADEQSESQVATTLDPTADGSGMVNASRSGPMTSKINAATAGTNAQPPASSAADSGGTSAAATLPPSAASASMTAPPGANAAGAAGASAPPTGADQACSTLRSCCSTLLDTREKGLCQAIADEQTTSLCKVASDDYCGATTTTSATTPVDECRSLISCCATLDEEDQEDCQAVADAAVATDCRASLRELCPGRVTTTTATTPATGACAMLDTSCCAMLEDDEDIEECQDAVAVADQAACQETLDALCGAGGDD